MNNIINEYDEKMNEQEQQNKPEIENLQFAYEDLEAKYNALSVDSVVEKNGSLVASIFLGISYQFFFKNYQKIFCNYNN